MSDTNKAKEDLVKIGIPENAVNSWFAKVNEFTSKLTRRK